MLKHSRHPLTLTLVTTTTVCLLACSGILGPRPEPPTPSARVPGTWFPLETGQTIRYVARKYTGAGPRILFQTSQPATTEVVGEWTLAIGEPDAEGHYATEVTQTAGDTTTETSFRLWMEGDELWMDRDGQRTQAIQWRIPPFPVSAERIPCAVPMFDPSLAGTCAPAWGGPRNTPPGLQAATIGTQVKKHADLAQVAVGILSLGTFIPGNRSSRTIIEAAGWTRPSVPDTPPLEDPYAEAMAHWRKGQREGRLDSATSVRRHVRDMINGYRRVLDAELASTLVASLKDKRAAAAADELLDAVADASKWPVTRVALQQQTQHDDRWHTWAVARPRLGALSPEHHAALRQVLDPEAEHASTDAMIDGRCVFTLAALASADSAFALQRRKVIESVHVVPAVDDIDCMLHIDPHQRGAVKHVTLLLERASDEDRDAMFVRALSALVDADDRVALLEAHPAQCTRLDAKTRANLEQGFEQSIQDADQLKAALSLLSRSETP